MPAQSELVPERLATAGASIAIGEVVHALQVPPHVVLVPGLMPTQAALQLPLANPRGVRVHHVGCRRQQLLLGIVVSLFRTVINRETVGHMRPCAGSEPAGSCAPTCRLRRCIWRPGCASCPGGSSCCTCPWLRTHTACTGTSPLTCDRRNPPPRLVGYC